MSIKSTLSSHERVMFTLDRVKPDRVPLFYRDVPEVRSRLLQELNLETDDHIFEYLGIDFRWVEPKYIGPELFDRSKGLMKDIWGTESKFVQFSDTGGYWETCFHPLEQVEEPEELEDYQWPCLEWFDFSVLSSQIDKYNSYAIMTAPGDASSPSILQFVQRLVGLENSWAMPALKPELFDEFVNKILDFVIPFIDKMLISAKGKIDFLRIGDDFGSQNGLIFSRQMWRDRLMLAYRKISDVVKSHDCYYYHHSCGAIRELIPDLIETGVDVLDPVQVKAIGMEPAALKADFGDKIVFSGGVDEQDLLPNGTPEQIKEGVDNLLDSMAQDGGFFIGPTHNFQDDIPTKNILAMYEAARDWK